MPLGEFLIDLHTRTHRSLAMLLDHCEGFPPEALARTLEGFGMPTILEQLHHAVGAERYWVSVLELATDASEDEADRESLASIREFRERTMSTTRAYLESRSDEELGSAIDCVDWRGESRSLVPARVIQRTQSHVFHHMGQITAMCRMLGSPVPQGFDYPVD